MYEIFQKDRKYKFELPQAKKLSELRIPTAQLSSTPDATLETKCFLLLPVYHAQN